MTTEQRIPVNIEDEMRRSYLDYAMSVIIGRALPDVRDGLKPAHRRVLYAMRQMGLASNRAYRKCAKVVGEVIGNYHPHGDVPAYDTLVRLAQDFNMRYTLVDGQGNFGSVDGDSPAAYRYTEARLEALAEVMMADLDKDTVDYVPNFDETTTEPTVLPTPFPNLLVNGSTGIAVGMATNVPPHNLREVIEGVVWLIEHEPHAARRRLTAERRDSRLTKEQKLRGLVERIPGPDFPTGGFIVGRQGIREAYLTGRGAIQVRAKAEIEPMKKGDRSQIVITEIPYQVNKAKLQERIADLVRDKVVEGISDIRDESDRDGMRVVIELKRGEVGEVVLNNLYKHTQLQQTFGIITLAIVGRPAARAHAAGGHRGIRRVPPRSRPAAHRVRAAQGRGARAHPRGTADRARQPRCGDHAHPIGEEPAGSQSRPDHPVRPERHPVAGHPGHAAAAADRPRAPEDSRRARRAGHAHHQPARHSRERAQAAADHHRRAAPGAAASTATLAGR